MLILQGTRDALADVDLLRAVARRLGPRATLHLVEQADHAFHVPVRSGRTDAAVLDELCATLAGWARDT
jgi:predicted alpha/beta-hydrolase family hydrolase